MGSSAFWSFADPIEYGRAIRACDAKALKISGRAFAADVVRMDLCRVWSQSLRESAPRVAQVATHSSRSIVVFRTDEAKAAIRHEGHELGADEIIFMGSGALEYQSTEGPVAFGSVSLSPADLRKLGERLAGRELVAPADSTFLRPDPKARSRLTFLNRAAAKLAKTKPTRLAHSEISRAFEDAFIVAMVRCVVEANHVETASNETRRAKLVRRMREYLLAKGPLPVYVAELCAAIGATERSLERACLDVLGMSPKRFLTLRRLHLARAALISAGAAETTVSNVALDHGFWEIGRFAVKYRELFGETPSATLGRRKRDLSALQIDPEFRLA